MNDWYMIFSSGDDWLIVFLRLILGIVMFPAGMQKLLGWFGGDGFKATVNEMTGMGLPKFIVWLCIIGESFGSIAVIFGFCTRIAAVGIFIIMAGAMVVSSKNGWFMNWKNDKKGEGIEYFVLFLAINLYVIVMGAGQYAIDNLIAASIGN